MKRLAFVEYAFMFDPEKTWARLYQFESEFSKFLDSKGMEVQIVDSVGVAGRKILYIYPKEAISPTPKQISAQPSSVKKTFQKMKKNLKKG